MISLHELIRSAYLDIQKSDYNKVLELVSTYDHNQELGLEDQLDLKVLHAKLLLELKNSDQAIINCRKVIQLSRDAEKIAPRFSGLVILSHCLFVTGQIQEAQIHLNELFELSLKLTDRLKTSLDSFIADYENLLGLMHQQQGHLEPALQEYQNSLSRRKRLGFQRDEGLSRYNIAAVYELQKKYETSMNYYKEALTLFEEVKFYEGIAASLNAIRKLYLTIGDSSSAFVYEQRYSDLQEKSELNTNLIQVLKENAELNNEVAILNNERLRLEQKIWQLEFELNSQDTVEKEETITTNVLEKTAEELILVQEKLFDSEEQLKEREAKLALLSQNQEELEKENLKLQEDRTGLKSEIEKLRIQYQRINDDGEEAERLKLQLREKEEEISKLQTELGKSRTAEQDHTQLHEKLKEREDKIRTLNL